LVTRFLLWLGPLVFIGLLFLLPVLRVLGLGLGSIGAAAPTGAVVANAAGIGLGADPSGLIAFTIGQAMVSTLLCLVLGVPLGYLLYRRRLFGQRFWRALTTLPFVLPTLVVAIGVRALFGGSAAVSGVAALAGILVAHLLLNVSLTVRAVGAAWSRLDLAQEESAELAGAGRLRTFTAVVLPQLRGAIAGAAALSFLYCVSSFSVILVLGGGFIRTIETQLSIAANDYLDLKSAGLLALAQTAITVVAFGLASRLGGLGRGEFDAASVGAVSDAAGTGEAHSRKADRRDLPAILLSLAPIALVTIGMLWVVGSKAFVAPDGSLGWTNFANLQGFGARDLLDISVSDSIANSLRNALISASIALVTGALVAWLLVHSRGRFGARLLDILFLLPLGTSTVVLGFGYLVSFAGPPLPLRDSWVAVPLAQAVIALPLVVRLVHSALQQTDRELLDAAATDGAGKARIFWAIELPLIRSTMLSAAAFAALVSLGEFGAASFLAFGDQATLPTELYRLISRPGAQNYGMAMAVATIMAALSLAVVWALSGDRRTRTRRQPRRVAA
jgi:thiamine transport system permease protein